MMNEQQIIKHLENFNEYATELLSYTFTDKMKGAGWSLRHKKGKGITTKFRGPDKEAFSATCNKVRMFIQENDKMSIYALKSLYNSQFILDSEKNEFKRVKDFFDSLQIGTTSYNINNSNITNRQVLETFLYGNVSHSTKKQLHDSWKKSPFYDGLKNKFALLIVWHLQLISGLIYVNNLVLKRMCDSNKPPVKPLQVMYNPL